MKDKIRLLPESLANQIAAGEVVQRPSSAIKELLENAIDAEAKTIHVIIKDGGKTLIQVSDNGIGMTANDARMCFERHATSKIQDSKDLFKIQTFGFRGEAVASIAAVSQMKLITLSEAQDIGTEVRVEGGLFIEQKPTSSQRGTTIQVKNLFYNVPARRNFLKSKLVEMRHIIDEFYRLAIPNSDKSFYLKNGNEEVLALKGSTLPKRIIQIFGMQYRDQLLACQETISSTSIKGYISKPSIAKKQRSKQFFFANGRFIRSSYLHHAVMSVYKNLLSPDTYPFYALFIQIPTENIDINVHPSKTEVKFEDPKLLYTLVQTAVKKALMQFAEVGNFEFSDNLNHFPAPSQTQSIPSDTSQNWNSEFPQKFTSDFSLPKSTPLTPLSESRRLDSLLSSEESTPLKGMEEEKKEYMIVQKKYLLFTVKSGLLLVDVQAGYERIFYEQIQNSKSANQEDSSSRLLFNKVIEFNASDYQIILENKVLIKTMGIDFEDFGKNSIVVHAAPLGVEENYLEAVLYSFLEQIKNHNPQIQLGANHEAAAQIMARRMAIEKIKYISDWQSEVDKFMEIIFSKTSNTLAPSGKRIFVILDSHKIERLFL